MFAHEKGALVVKSLRMSDARRSANARYRARMKGNAQFLARQRERAAERRQIEQAALNARNDISHAFRLLARLPPPCI